MILIVQQFWNRDEQIMFDATKKKLSRRDLIGRVILAVILTLMFLVTSYYIYKDYQDSKIVGIGDLLPEEHLKYIESPEIGR